MIRLLSAVSDARRAGAVRRYLAALFAFALAQGAAYALLVPILRALFAGEPSRAWPWILALGWAAVVCAVLQYTQAVLGFGVGLDLSRALYHRLGDTLAGLPLGWFSTDRTGRLGRMVTQGVTQVMGVPAHLLQPLVTAYVTPAVVVLVTLATDWRLGLALAVGGALLAGTYRIAAGLTGRADRAVDDAGVTAGGRVVEYARAQAVLRAFGRTSGGYAQLDDALRAQHRAGRRLITGTVSGQAMNALAVQATYTAVLVLGVRLALSGTIGAADLVAVLVLATRFTEPLVLAADLGGALRIGANSLRRFADVFATPTMPEPAESAVPGAPTVELRGVAFGYDDRPVLRDVSLTVPAGTMTALVGASGSGKTTVTRLIARFFDVDAGSVLVGGHDVRDLSTEALMGQLSMVFQDVYLFDDTILGNIRVGRPAATDAEVADAARLARVDEIAARLPDGWDTRVGEGGTRLSGGERQRVSIARALLKDAPIVLLDEATAALDARNDAAVSAALRSLAGRRTLLVIAHRLATIAAADQIVFLRDGRIAEVGTHPELLAAGGDYARFWAERNRAGGWRLAGAGER
ncbi:ABC transporter ATP-binding protein [Longispora sp. NPDC051575]|uniref:ABC transporter ATP-binding protein n=1 Tax=Longispora sp. NPDC051575 TaxID=3154943 RepID=UPI0034368E6F